MKNIFIEKIYKETIQQVLKGIPLIYHKEIKINYKNNLIQSYQKIKVDETNFETKLSNFIPSELSYWKDLPVDNKLSLLIKDQAYDEIVFISNYGLKMAQKKHDEGVSLDSLMAKCYINRIEELLKTVKSFNLETNSL